MSVKYVEILLKCCFSLFCLISVTICSHTVDHAPSLERKFCDTNAVANLVVIGLIFEPRNYCKRCRVAENMYVSKIFEYIDDIFLFSATEQMHLCHISFHRTWDSSCSTVSML